MTMKINDNGTGRDMTETEIANHETVFAEIETNKKTKQEAEAAKALQRQAVLDKLGLTQDEAQALLG